MDLIRVELPSRISSASDLLFVPRQIPGSDSIASHVEYFCFFFRSRDVPSLVRSECLIDVLLFGGCSPQNFTLLPDKIPSRVLL